MYTNLINYLFIHLTYLLTHSMAHSPSWKANWFAASQEIPRISWNPNSHYHIHRCPPTLPILSHLDPVHAPTSHFLKIHFNIILPSTPSSSKWPLSYLLTHSIQHSPSWEANRSSTSQEIPHILWNPKVHYRIYKCPLSVPILSQIDPVHNPRIPLPEDSSKYYHPIINCVFQVVFFPQIPPPTPCIRLYSPPYMLHTLTNLILLDFITRKI